MSQKKAKKKPNSPQPKSQQVPAIRPLEQISAEYREICMQAGDLQYKLKSTQMAIDRMNFRLQQLNQEANAAEAIKKAADEALASKIDPTAN